MQSSQKKHKTVNPLSILLLIFQGALVGVGYCILRGNLQDPFSKIISLLLRLYPGIFRHCQRTFLFSGKISGSFCLCLCRSHYRNAPFPVSRSRRTGPQQRVLCFHDSMYVCDLRPSYGTSHYFHRSCPKFLLVSLLWILPGPEPDRSGNEFFHPAHAVRPVYAFCRRDRPF